MKPQLKEGILIIDKPKDMTSHDVVDCIRHKFKIRKVGHGGTLDPLATGVLVVLVGRATKFARYFLEFDKEYEGTLFLGITTSTGDAAGRVIKQELVDVDYEKAKEVFSEFLGEIKQIPPMVSALRYGGERLYNLARKGIEINRPPRAIRVYCLELVDFQLPRINFRVRCSKGTYIRKLCEDIGERLGCGGYQSSLRRIKVGPFSINEAVKLDKINETHLRDFPGHKRT